MKIRVLILSLFLIQFSLGQSLGKVLIITKTDGGYRENNIQESKDLIVPALLAANIEVDTTEDAGTFTTQNLANYKAIMWLKTSGDMLNTSQEDAFINYIDNGGGYVGIHAAISTERDWKWYEEFLGGAIYVDHAGIQDADVYVENTTHISTQHMPAKWSTRDEWYNYRANPRNNSNVLATVDESTYPGGTMGADHPITWYRQYALGRQWVSAMGHVTEVFQDSLFMNQIVGGTIYAMGYNSLSPINFKLPQKALAYPIQIQRTNNGYLFENLTKDDMKIIIYDISGKSNFSLYLNSYSKLAEDVPFTNPGLILYNTSP